NRSFEGIAAYGTFSWRDRASHDGTIHAGQLVSGNYFDVLGVRPAIGRGLMPADDSIESTGGPSGPVAVLSDRYWRAAFHADTSVLGRTVNVNGVWTTVVGVAPPGFSGAQLGNSPDLFVPLQLQPSVLAPNNWLHNKGNSETTWVTVIGR